MGIVEEDEPLVMEVETEQVLMPIIDHSTRFLISSPALAQILFALLVASVCGCKERQGVCVNLHVFAQHFFIRSLYYCHNSGNKRNRKATNMTQPTQRNANSSPTATR